MKKLVSSYSPPLLRAFLNPRSAVSAGWRKRHVTTNIFRFPLWSPREQRHAQGPLTHGRRMRAVASCIRESIFIYPALVIYRLSLSLFVYSSVEIIACYYPSCDDVVSLCVYMTRCIGSRPSKAVLSFSFFFGGSFRQFVKMQEREREPRKQKGFSTDN